MRWSQSATHVLAASLAKHSTSVWDIGLAGNRRSLGDCSEGYRQAQGQILDIPSHLRKGVLGVGIYHLARINHH